MKTAWKLITTILEEAVLFSSEGIDFFGLFFPKKLKPNPLSPISEFRWSTKKIQRWEEFRENGKKEQKTHSFREKQRERERRRKCSLGEAESEGGRRETARERAAVSRGAATRSHVSTIEGGRSGTPDSPHPSLLLSTAFPSCDSSSHIKYHWPRDPRASGAPDVQHACCLQLQ